MGGNLGCDVPTVESDMFGAVLTKELPVAPKFRGSLPFAWDGWHDLSHFIVDALLVAGAVVCDQLTEHAIPWLGDHAGYWGPTIAAIAGSTLFGLKRWMTDTRTPA